MSTQNRFVALVVDVNDPEKAGRVKIRIYGIHDDPTRIPDDMLPWARCVFPVTNPINNGIAGATTGLTVNSTVVGYYVDAYNQLPLVDGTLGSVTDKQSDFPTVNTGEDTNSVIGGSVLHVGTAELKFLKDKTIGSIKYLGQDIDKMLTQIKEGNIKGSIAAVKQTIETFNRIKDTVTNYPIEQINSVIQGFASDLSQLAEDQVDSIITSELGNVIGGLGNTGLVGPLEDANKALNSVSHIIGALGSRKSKSLITSTQDALNKLSGHRFVMGNMMGTLDSSLAKLRIQMNKGK